MDYLNEQFIGEEIDCEELGIGTIVEINEAEVKIATEYGIIELALEDVELEEEAEDLEELSKTTVADYIKTASNDAVYKSVKAGSMHRARKDTKLTQRERGITTGLNKLVGSARIKATESVDLEEGTMKPYVKPHYDAKNNQSGWKASNKHGKVKFFGKDFKPAALKHAGLNEDLDESYAAASKKAEASRQRAIKSAANAYKIHGNIDRAIKDHDLFAKDAEKIKALAEENLEELSKKTLGSYINKARSQESLGWYKQGNRSADSKDIKTVVKRNVGIAKAVDKLTKEETEALEEGRGRKPKQPKEGEKPTAAWLRHLERQKSDKPEKEEVEALGAQLRKAVSINKPVTFLNGDKKEVTAGHAELFHDHMAARKMTADKQKFQNDAHASHDAFMKAIKSPIPGR